MDLYRSFVLGIVEGLTEFLPVSSTGHLILAGRALGVNEAEGSAFTDAFEVVIQAGALAAVALHYRSMLARHAAGLWRREPESVRLAVALGVGFAPAAVLGLLFHHAIERRLFGVTPVVLALAVGGVAMLVVQAWRRVSRAEGLEGVQHVTPVRALVVGVAQCASLWPGMSRSMTTIVGGQLAGLSTATATEFSFLLALPTLGAATTFKLIKARGALVDSGAHVLNLAVGTIVSFLVAWAVIRAFLRYVRHWGLAPFGVYRLLLAAALVVTVHP